MEAIFTDSIHEDQVITTITPINKKHVSISDDFLERVMGLINGPRKVKKYAVEETYHNIESLELEINKTTKVQIQIVVTH